MKTEEYGPVLMLTQRQRVEYRLVSSFAVRRYFAVRMAANQPEIAAERTKKRPPCICAESKNGGGPMIKVVTPILFALAIAASNAAVAATLFDAAFDKVQTGAFPAGWTLRYNGAGTADQIVDATHSASKPNSLKLEGSGCWSANAYHPVKFPAQGQSVDTHVQLSAEVFVSELGSGGCSNITAYVALENPSVGEWGSNYAGVIFANDGFVYSPVNNSTGAKLGKYSLNSWINVSLDIDLTANTAEISVDGVLLGSGIKLPTTFVPTGVELCSGHGANNPVSWFDNVRISTPAVSE